MANSKPSNDTTGLLRQAAKDVLEGAVFQRSKANSEMLLYLLEETYAGHAETVSEYSIAIDLLGRGGDFDPAADPIVRVRMRRLREALSRHYALSDTTNQPKLVLPKGRYLLQVSVPEPDPEPNQIPETAPIETKESMFDAMQWAAALFLSLSVLTIVWSIWWPSHSPIYQNDPPLDHLLSDYPLIDIPEFQNVTGVSDFDRYERDFQLHLAADIQNFDRLRVHVLSLDRVNQVHQPHEALPSFRISGSILELDDVAEVFVSLVEKETGEQVFAKRFSVDVEEGDVMAALATMSDIVSGHIVGQNGAISNFFRDKVMLPPHVYSFGVFRCVVLTDIFLVQLQVQDYQAARTCFAPYVERGLEDPVAAASWGLLLYHAVPEFHLMSLDGVPQRFYQTAEAVQSYAESLVNRFPSSASAYLLAGAVNTARAEPVRAISALQRAVELNSADPTALSVLSYAYMAEDQHVQALAAARKAIQESAMPAPFMYVPILVGGVVLGDADLAYDAAKNVARQQSPGTDTALLVAAQLAGDLPRVAALRPKVMALEYPMQGLDVFVRGEKAMRAFMVLLAAAGVTQP